MMKIARCKTCKHWKNLDKYEAQSEFGLGLCQAVPMFWESTQWNESGTERELAPEARKQTAFVQDASDYSASLYTMPEHGCTLHEKGESE